MRLTTFFGRKNWSNRAVADSLNAFASILQTTRTVVMFNFFSLAQDYCKPLSFFVFAVQNSTLGVAERPAGFEALGRSESFLHEGTWSLKGRVTNDGRLFAHLTDA